MGTTFHKVYLEGPPPEVKIGKVPLRDICLGTVQLIIDGNLRSPVSLFLVPMLSNFFPSLLTVLK
jgi:hypothetical protein